MQVWNSIKDLAEIPGPVVLALGVFDGVHLGHQAVLSRAMELAETLGGTAVATTFHPHPLRVLRPEKAPLLLTSLPHQKLLLSRLGIGHLLVIPFTAEFATSAAIDFVDALVSSARPLGGIVTGTDFCFGRARSGDAAMLESEGQKRGFTAIAIPPVLVDTHRVSSTLVRRAVSHGDFAACTRLLGRQHAVLGTVVRGRELGRTIGFPTANLHVHSEQLPPMGVYAVTACLDQQWLPGVANLGRRPTVETNGQPLLEVHLFDFERDLYGRDIEVSFQHFLRPEMSFSGLEALTAQIHQDAAQAREMLAGV